MSSIKIITDTDASLSPDLAAQWGVLQVPMTVHFDQEVLVTWKDIDDERLFQRIDRDGKLPTTSAPSPGSFAEAYRLAFEDGADAVICFTVSSAVSAAYSAALSACETLPGKDITVVDSKSLSMGQGFMVLAAAEAARSGTSKENILAIAQDIQSRSYLYVALSTLKYLAMSGRVGHLAAGMADLLRVKPILTIQDGKLGMLERVRTRKKAWSRVIELAVQAANGRTPERMAIVHVNALADARRFYEELSPSLPFQGEPLYIELTPGLSVHSGAGLVGVAFVAGK